MNPTTDESQFPSLFAHRIKKEWGVGVLADEKDGKRRYLFEGGEERALAKGFYELMLRVDSPTPEQQLTYARLQGMLAARAGSEGGGKGAGWTLAGQLVRFRAVFEDGLSDSRWASEVRGDRGRKGTGRRQAIATQAQTMLARAALDGLIEAGKYSEAWDRLKSVLTDTDLVPAAKLKTPLVAGEPQRNLAVRLRDLLHGDTPYEQRFDRWVSALGLAFGEPPRWELATAPSGVFFPTEHVAVEPTAFRKQLKACGGRSVGNQQPTSSDYGAFLSIARLLANQLASHGEVPRDLLDVRDFVVTSMKPVPKAAAAKAPKKREESVPDDGPSSLDDD
jgi:hypothetical protein